MTPTPTSEVQTEIDGLLEDLQTGHDTILRMLHAAGTIKRRREAYAAREPKPPAERREAKVQPGAYVVTMEMIERFRAEREASASA